MQRGVRVPQPYPAPGPAGGELHPRQYVDDGQARWSDTGDIADHGPAPGLLKSRAHLGTEPRCRVPGDGAWQHEYGGCRRVHDR